MKWVQRQDWFRRLFSKSRRVGKVARPAAINRSSGQQRTIELLEPRCLLAANLVYADLDNPPTTLSAGDITAYLASGVSTNFTLRAEADGGNVFWRMYGTGTDDLPIPATRVLNYQINTAADLDVNISRDDLGLVGASGLSFIDFIGDRLTVDLDSFSALDGRFTGTTIDIDFNGGLDLSRGSVFGGALAGAGTLPTVLGDDQMLLVGNGGTFNNHPLLIHSTSDIITSNASNPTGLQITSGSDIQVLSDSAVTVDAGSAISANNISLLAFGSELIRINGLLVNAASSVTVSGATLTATNGTVTLNALSRVDMTGANAENGSKYFINDVGGSVVTSFSTATVNVVGSTTITSSTLDMTATVDVDIHASVQAGTVKFLTVWAAGDSRVNIGDANGTTRLNVAGNLTSEAKSDIKIDAHAQPSTSSNASVDAAVVNVNIVDVGIPIVVPNGFTSGAKMSVGGGAIISAGNRAAFKATDLIDVTTTADGSVPNTFGATFSGTVIDSDTTAAITGNAAVTAPTVDLLASTTRTIATTAKSTPGGAQDDNNANTTNQSQQALASNNAKTADGDLTIAGAVVVNHVEGTTNTFINSAAATAVTASTAFNVGATSTDSVSAIADASGTGSPGLAIAVALNFADLQVNAYLDGNTLNLQAATVNVTATENGANTFHADATSGAGSQNVGLAGALTTNSIDTATRAFVDDGTAVSLNSGSLNLAATNATTSTADAKPKKDGASGQSVGIGASVAMNLIDNLTEAMVENGAVVTGGAVNLSATGDHDINSKATMSASGGTAITPVVAMTFANNTTRAVFDTSSVVTTTGDIAANATQDVDITTAGLGDAAGSGSLAAGGIFAYVSARDVVATLANGALTSTNGNVGLTSQSRSAVITDSKASAGGAADKGENADQQAAAQKNLAQGQGGSGSSKDTPSAKTADGPVGIAAAMSWSVVDANISSVVTGTINAGGTVTIRSLANQDASTVADGQATKTGAVGIGAAAAVSRTDLVNVAQVRSTGIVTGDGVTIEAGMRDVGETQHDVSTSAVSGAGSESGSGIAGAFAMTISTTDTHAGVVSGGTVTLSDGNDVGAVVGPLTINATEHGKNTATAIPMANGGDVGIGASIAFAIPTHKTVAEVEDDAAINGANNVIVQAKSSLDTLSFSRAGVKGGDAALSPVAAISNVETTTLARVGSGDMTLTGDLSILADHTGDSESRTDGSVESSDAAIGLSFAWTSTEENEDARLERSVIAGGNILVDASGLHDSSAEAKATAVGAKDKDTDSRQMTVEEKGTQWIRVVTLIKQENPPAPTPPPVPGRATVYFKTAEPRSAADYSNSLTPAYKTILDESAQYLQANPTAIATVYGFTDTVYHFQDNLDLAKRRAEAVKEYLVSQGASASQVFIEWLGEASPAKKTGDGVESGANRRAEVRITAPDAVRHEKVVLFDTDEFLLDETVGTRPNGQPEDDTDDPHDFAIIDEFAAILLANPNAIGTVIGHTDSRASNDYNITLSMRRAQSVANRLIQEKHVPESQLRVGWHGEFDQVVNTGDGGNDSSLGTEENANRRVTMRVAVAPPRPPENPAPQPPEERVKYVPTPTTKTKTINIPGNEEDGAVAVAAAIAINAPDSNTTAAIGGNVTIVAQGFVTVRGRANTSALAFADGSAVSVPSSTTVGAAVAIDAAQTDNRATIAGANITADGINVGTLMLDNKVGLTVAEPQVVDVAADTILVGSVDGLRTGDKVKYTTGGGAALQGLTNDTDYFVIREGRDKIKLATSLQNANAGMAINIGSLGTGDAHKLDREVGDEIVFDPDLRRTQLTLARDTAWATGEAVVYDNGGGTNITGLTNGTT